MAHRDDQKTPSFWRRIRANFETPEAQKPVGAQSFALTLLVLAILVVLYALAHAATLVWAEHLHTEQSALDVDRMALVLDTAQLETDLLAPPALAGPAIDAVLNALERSVVAAEDADTVSALFEDAVESLVSLGIPEDAPHTGVISATEHITALLGGARDQAQALNAAAEGEREVPQRLLEIELAQAKNAVLDYVAIPTMIKRIDALQKLAHGLGYGPNSDVAGALSRMAEELRKDQPNRALAAEMLKQIEEDIRDVRMSLFWRDPVFRWVEIIAWSLAGILATRLMSAGRYIGKCQYKTVWDRWWWAKIILAPLMAVPVIAFLTYLTIDVQSRETLGIQVSLKDQPIEIVISFAFIIGMFSNQAYKFLQNMAAKILPEDDDAGTRSQLTTVEGTPIEGRAAAEVQAELEEKGFKIKIEEQEKPAEEAAPGTVLGRKPAGAKLEKGAEITLIVVKAPEP